MKTLYLLLIMIGMISCTPSTVTPVPTTLETSLEGEWYCDYIISAGDTSWQYSTNSACRVTLTLNASAQTGSYIAYGTIGGCAYPSEYPWSANEVNSTINTDWVIEEITSSSLRLSHNNGFTYIYYK